MFLRRPMQQKTLLCRTDLMFADARNIPVRLFPAVELIRSDLIVLLQWSRKYLTDSENLSGLDTNEYFLLFLRNNHLLMLTMPAGFRRVNVTPHLLRSKVWQLLERSILLL